MTQHYVFRHESCGSVLTIDMVSSNDPTQLVQDCFLLCDAFEQRYSRFIPWNWLDTINNTQEQSISIDSEAEMLIRFSLELAEKTHGKFDPTIIRTLESYGYDKEYSFQRKAGGTTWYQHIDLHEHTLILHHGVKLEFGAVGKGYLLDLVAHELISAGYTHFLLDFGGDMIGYGGYEIGLENPFDLSQVIGTINLDGFAIASSNGMKRKVGEFHHLLDPHTGLPVRDIAWVYIAAQTGLIADAYSTAVFVSWAEKGQLLLANTPEISGAIVFSDGSFWQKDGYPGSFFS